ncbi:unnamed protein product [Kluyveromyces dobzhanskii CBS 2104]|uniref:WGS project CCBQ000000000 data, contig 00008 n=1 Tax=Kluyveromyces dobzhanskii CBS 2104 TaxID=1427455 RepID=A0A0A8L9H2_9SACH|nr:unnamed protein product [Kluyveromyces dobzhanskii CBS 2104]
MPWQETKDPQGRVYYFNDKGETTWEKPEELLTEFERKLLKHGWKTALAEDGRVYYYNSETGETTWNVPHFEDNEVKSEVKPSQKSEQVDSTAEVKSTSLDTSEELDVKEILENSDDKYKNKSELLVVRKAASKEEAEKVFLQMLVDNEVDSTWSFNRIIGEIGNKDPRYWIIDDDPLWKQTLFDKFLANRTEAELMKEHQHLEKFEQAFSEMLAKLPNVHYYSRWKTIRRQIMNEPIYKYSVIDEKQKKGTFQRYISSLQSKEQAEHNKTRAEALNELNLYFESLVNDIDPINLPWNKFATKYLWGSARFDSNKNFTSLTKSDVFKLYTTVVESKMTKMKTQNEILRSKNFRSDRRARFEYKKLLDELSPHIKHNSTWKDIYPLLKTDTRFTNMLGRSGSSALDLFFDRVDEAELVLKAKCSVANQVFISKGLDFDRNAPEEIRQSLHDNNHLSNMSPEDINSVIARLKESHEKKKQEAWHRKLELQLGTPEARAFESKLKSVSSIKNLSKWEDILVEIKDDPTYQGLPKESGKMIFDNLVHKGLLSRKRQLEEPMPSSNSSLDY